MKGPKNVRLIKDTKRLVGACLDHKRKSLNHLLLINDKPLIKDNADLADTALCSSNKIACTAGIYKSCKNFKKIHELNIDKLHCSKNCVADNEDCSAKNVFLREQNNYTKTKKKLQLFDKVLNSARFVDLLKTTLIGFPCNRFNVNHTSKTYYQAIAGVTNTTIVKTQDFSENYKCLLPEEIMSIHWTQEQATVYPVVVLRKIDDV